MSADAWDALAAALPSDGAEPVRFWLRDDDAVTDTPALERLDALCVAGQAPLLLAVIPASATPALGRWAAARPLVAPCQHGYAHANHAGPEARACELGGARDDAAVLRDIDAGRAAMKTLFGAAWTPILVPPWNRIRPSLLPHLAPRGYAALSTFAGAIPPEARALPMIDCDLDIIDWRNGRRGREHGELCRRLCGLVAVARETGAPIGILTHHLAHDDGAWRFLERLVRLLAAHPGARFAAAEALLSRAARPEAPPARR